MAEQIQTKAKIQYQHDVRFWHYSNASDFSGLSAFVKSAWGISEFIIQYRDEDGDLMTIACGQDLSGAFQCAKQQNKSLKMFVGKGIPKPKKSYHGKLYNKFGIAKHYFHVGGRIIDSGWDFCSNPCDNCKFVEHRGERKHGGKLMYECLGH